MGQVNPGDTVRVTAKMLLGSEEVANVYHVNHKGSVAVDADQFHDDVTSWLQAAYDGIEDSVSDQLIDDVIDTYNMSQDVPILSTGWPGSFQGNDAGQAEPYQIAALITFPTAVKRSLGKKYLPGLSETGVLDAGVLSSTIITDLAAFAVDLLAGFLVLGETFEAGNYRPLTDTFIQWGWAIIEGLVSTQRRRKPGVGA